MCFLLFFSVFFVIGFVVLVLPVVLIDHVGKDIFGKRFSAWHGRPKITPTNNRAFDEYHAETLRRLEDDRREFVKFIDGLHFAKDKAVFDQFTTARQVAEGHDRDDVAKSWSSGTDLVVGSRDQRYDRRTVTVKEP